MKSDDGKDWASTSGDRKLIRDSPAAALPSINDADRHSLTIFAGKGSRVGLSEESNHLCDRDRRRT